MNFPVRNGFALVDAPDYERLIEANYNWYIDDHGYVVCWVGERKDFYRMHNWILDYNGPLEIDHENRNRQDNQRHNLRIVEHYVNLHNSKLRTDNTNGFKGVFQNTAGNWGYQTWIKGVKFTKQGFRTKELAYAAKVEFLATKQITIT